MNYFKSLIFNFFLIFFVNYLTPGIDVMNQTKLPHIGGELIFAAALGLLNSLLVPILRKEDGHLTWIRLSVAALVLNFISYALLKLLPLGISITHVEGYLVAAFVVSVGSVILGYATTKKHVSHQPPEEPPQA